MKKRLLLLLVFGLFFCLVQAQPHLRINALVNWPDTAYQSQVVPVSAIVENIGTAPYQGALQIALQTDTNTFSYLYFNGGATVLILPGDTLWFTPPNGYPFDSANFKPGNNVVVVWPYTTQSIQVDTFQTEVFFIALQLTPVNSPEPVRGLRIGPNPTRREVWLESNETLLEGVRILSMDGRELGLFPASGKQRLEIDLGYLPPGIYLLQALGRDGERSVYRLVKQE